MPLTEKYGCRCSQQCGNQAGACVVLRPCPRSGSSKNIVGDMSRFRTAIHPVCMGRGSDIISDLYEISNQRTLGQSRQGREIVGGDQGGGPA